MLQFDEAFCMGEKGLKDCANEVMNNIEGINTA